MVTMPYDNVMMPNLLGHRTQEEAKDVEAAYNLVHMYGCSPDVLFFLCSLYAPNCTVSEE